jgi:hypothetical protein
MRQDYEKLFSNIETPEPPTRLIGAVVARIQTKERQSALIRSVTFAIGLVASLIAFVPALRSVQAAMAESGFLAYLGLLFSDTGAILSTSRNFALILLESLPVFSLALFLVILFLLLESAFHLITDTSRLFSLRTKTL